MNQCKPLAGGAAVDRAADDRVTPLWIAAQEGHEEVVAALVAGGAQVDAAAKVGRCRLTVSKPVLKSPVVFSA